MQCTPAQQVTYLGGRSRCARWPWALEEGGTSWGRGGLIGPGCNLVKALTGTSQAFRLLGGGGPRFMPLSGQPWSTPVDPLPRPTPPHTHLKCAACSCQSALVSPSQHVPHLFPRDHVQPLPSFSPCTLVHPRFLAVKPGQTWSKLVRPGQTWSDLVKPGQTHLEHIARRYPSGSG